MRNRNERQPVPVRVVVEQHREMVRLVREQTAAIGQLTASNRELVAVLAQLVLADTPEQEGAAPVASDGAHGMDDSVGGYVQRDHNGTAQQWER